jgi:hypothetical protein
LPQGNILYGIAYGNNTFVAVGRNEGAILTSPDGGTWTVRPSGISNWLRGIVYGKTIFVAVGKAGTILTSQDRLIWAYEDFDGESLRGELIRSLVLR